MRDLIAEESCTDVSIWTDWRSCNDHTYHWIQCWIGDISESEFQCLGTSFTLQDIKAWLWKVEAPAMAANTVSFNCRILGAKHRFVRTGDATMPTLQLLSSLSIRRILNGWELRLMNLLLCWTKRNFAMQTYWYLPTSKTNRVPRALARSQKPWSLGSCETGTGALWLALLLTAKVSTKAWIGWW